MKKIALAGPAAILAAGSFAGQAHATVLVIDHTFDITSPTDSSFDVKIGGVTSPQFLFTYDAYEFGEAVKSTTTFALAAGQTGWINGPGTTSTDWARNFFTDYSSSDVNVGFQIAGTNYDGVASFVFDDINARFTLTQIDYDVAAVPEPATWGMMLLGMGLVGGTMRRRRQAALATA